MRIDRLKLRFESSLEEEEHLLWVLSTEEVLVVLRLCRLAL